MPPTILRPLVPADLAGPAGWLGLAAVAPPAADGPLAFAGEIGGRIVGAVLLRPEPHGWEISHAAAPGAGNAEREAMLAMALVALSAPALGAAGDDLLAAAAAAAGFATQNADGWNRFTRGTPSHAAGQTIQEGVAAAASSQYGAFGPARLVDGDRALGGWISAVNAWQDAELTFTLPRPAMPTAIEVVNGFIEEGKVGVRDDYWHHLRPHLIELRLGDHLTVPVELTDSKEPQVHPLPLVGPVDRVYLTVRTVYRDGPDIRSFDVVGLRHVAFWIA